MLQVICFIEFDFYVNEKEEEEGKENTENLSIQVVTYISNEIQHSIVS